MLIKMLKIINVSAITKLLNKIFSESSLYVTEISFCFVQRKITLKMKTKKNFLCDHKKVLKSESIFSFQFKDLSNSESKIKENKLVPVSRRPPPNASKRL